MRTIKKSEIKSVTLPSGKHIDFLHELFEYKKYKFTTFSSGNVHAVTLLIDDTPMGNLTSIQNIEEICDELINNV